MVKLSQLDVSKYDGTSFRSIGHNYDQEFFFVGKHTMMSKKTAFVLPSPLFSGFIFFEGTNFRFFFHFSEEKHTSSLFFSSFFSFPLLFSSSLSSTVSFFSFLLLFSSSLFFSSFLLLFSSHTPCAIQPHSIDFKNLSLQNKNQKTGGQQEKFRVVIFEVMVFLPRK